ncbi:MAG: glycosyltransferase [Oscillospiraceae bacterium]|nr:glycosyltransferase [Oscillospiraceae bacterium]
MTPFFAYNEGGLLAQRMTDADVPSVKIAMKSRFDFGAARRLAKFCRDNNVDIIHTHFLRENYIALMSRLFYSKTRVVYTNHILMKNGFITRLMNRFFSPLQHRVIAVCEAGKKLLVKSGFPERIIEVIHNGIDARLWACERRGKNEPLTFIYVARVVEGKGHEFLLRAAALIKDKPFRLVIAGDGNLFGDMILLAERLGIWEKVIFTGFCEDVKPMLAAADVFISASESEALSISILEAMASGLPVIATDVGGNPEIILGAGCGVLVPYNEPKVLADAMADMLANAEARGKYGQASLEAVNGEFSVETMYKKTMEVYRR